MRKQVPSAANLEAGTIETGTLTNVSENHWMLELKYASNHLHKQEEPQDSGPTRSSRVGAVAAGYFKGNPKWIPQGM